MCVCQTFESFWKENEKTLWRNALNKWGGFYSMSSGDWEDAFQEASIRINEISLAHGPGVVINLSFAKQIMNLVFHEKYREYCDINRIVVNIKPPNDEDERINIFEGLPVEEPIVNEKRYAEFMLSIDGFVDSCAKQYVKQKRDVFHKSVEHVKWLFYERIKNDRTGEDIMKQTNEIKENGWQENAQSNTLKFMRECIAKRAILAGFEEDVSTFRN